MESRHYKIAVFGAPGVGKTAFVNQLCFEKFTEKYMLVSDPVVGTFKKDDVSIEVTEVAGYIDLHIDKVPFSKFQNVSAALLMFSIIDKKSFDDLAVVLKEMRKHIKRPIFLIANKIDLKETHTIKSEVIEEFAKINEIYLIEISSRNRSNIIAAMKLIIEEVELHRLLADIRAILAIVGPSRITMKDELLEKCTAAESIQEGIAALKRCGDQAQKDHVDRSGSRFLWFGPLFHPTSATKMKTDDLVDRYEGIQKRIVGL